MSTDRLLLLIIGVGALAGGFGLIGLAIAFVGARVISLIAAYVLAAGQIGPFRPTFDGARWLELQRRALPFGAFVVVLYLYSYADTVMLGVIRGDVETGLYNAAYRIYEGLANVGQVLQTVLIPRLSRYYASSRAAHGRLARGGLLAGGLLGLPTAAVGFVLAGPVVVLLFGAAYAPAGGVLQLLAAGLIRRLPALRAPRGGPLGRGRRLASADCRHRVRSQRRLEPPVDPPLRDVRSRGGHGDRRGSEHDRARLGTSALLLAGGRRLLRERRRFSVRTRQSGIRYARRTALISLSIRCCFQPNSSAMIRAADASASSPGDPPEPASSPNGRNGFEILARPPSPVPGVLIFLVVHPVRR